MNEEFDEFEMCDSCNKTPNTCTLCTGDHNKNIWWEKGQGRFPGRCLLDQLTYDQVYFILQRNPNAARDLMRITSDSLLLRFARDTKLVVTDFVEDQECARRLNANTLPYYTVLRGNISGGF